MSKTFGDIPFIVFYDTVLSRLAYSTSNSFLQSYIEIFGPIIPVSLMNNINNASITNIFNPDTYKISGDIPSYSYNSKKYVDFTSMAEKVNAVTNKFYQAQPGSVQKGGVNEIKGSNYSVAYISISTSNYGGYYILVDTRMPNSIFVVFRGTYSAKSAGSYSKPTSIVPYAIAKDLTPEQLKTKLAKDQGKMYGVLTGVNKILDDVYHTIIQSMMYLANTYLKPTTPNSIKVFTTGHSLGGGLCTLFANDWFETAQIPPYNAAPFNVFSKRICCVSIASPRVMSPGLSNNFCEKTQEKYIMYRRITNRGDPVPAMPQKSYTGMSEGFQHPCSAKKFSSTQRNVISLDCGSAMQARPTPMPVYTKSLDCRNTKTSMFQGNVSGNPLAHTMYLYINFVTAVPVSEFISSSLPSMVKKRPTEIQRTPKGATVTRIILGSVEERNNESNIEFKSAFFNLNDLRPKDKQVLTTNPDAKPVTTEDTLMDTTIFTNVITNLKPLTGDLNPVVPESMEVLNTDGNKPMPTIDGILSPTITPSFPSSVKSGGKRTRKMRKSSRTRRANKSRKTNKSRRGNKTRRANKKRNKKY